MAGGPSPMSRAGVPRIEVLAAATAVAGLATVTLLVATGWAGGAVTGVLAEWGTTAVGLVALAVPALRLRRPARDRRAWAVVTLGLAGWNAADVAWALTGHPELSWADLGWLAFYPLTYAGLALCVRATLADVPLVVWLDGLISALLVGAVGTAVVLPAIRPAEGREGLDLVVNTAYPVADLVLVGVVVSALALTSWRPTAMWALLAAGFGLSGAGDTLYLAGIARDATVPDWLLGALWTGSFVLISLASLCPARTPAPRRVGAMRLLFAPAAFGLVAVMLLLREGIDGGRALGSALAGATLVVIAGRMAIHVHEVRKVSGALRAARDLAERDPLTGLLNHGAFHAALRRECARASRAGAPLSLVLLDLDHFKQINDCHGHLAGDEVLRAIGRLLREQAREGDVVARTGGEELAWILPGSDLASARAAAERLRLAVATGRAGDIPVTISLGVALRGREEPAEGFFVRADAALYWAKEAGRDRVVAYEADTQEMRLEGQRAMPLRATVSGRMVRALRLTVDAADPAVASHCDRVADTAVRLASVLGWPPHRLMLLHEAASVHDVGRVGPAAAGRPDPAAVSAAIVQEVLSEEQGGWVRDHLAGWAGDGPGAPDEGARILGVADAWDVLTGGSDDARAVSAGLTALRGLRERALWPPAVEALSVLAEAGALEPVAALRAV